MNDSRTRHPLADRLSAEANSIGIADTPVEVVVARGRQRQHRRRTAVGLAAVVAIAGTALGSVAVLTRQTAPQATGSDESLAPDTAAPPTSDATAIVPVSTGPANPVTVDTTMAVNKVPPSIAWNVVESNSAEALGMTFGAVVGGGPYLAWSTQPASAGINGDFTPTLWRSDDAVSWQQVPTAVPLSTQMPMLAAQGDRFLTFGTTVAAAGEVEARVAFSDDAAASWSTATLPLDLATLRADPAVRTVGVNPSAIAATDTAVVLAVNVNPILDVERLLGPTAKYLGYQATEAGLVVTGSCSSDGSVAVGTVVPTTVVVDSAAMENGATQSPPTSEPYTCDDSIVGLHPWSDLGIAPATVEAIFHPTRVLVSSDGTAFTEIELPTSTPGATLVQAQLATYDDGFALVANWFRAGSNEQSTTIYLSADGTTWREGEAPAFTYISSLSGFGDRLVIMGTDDPSYLHPLAAVGTPDAGWIITDLAGLLGPDDGVKPTLGLGPQVVADATGITVTGWVNRDWVAEAGGITIERGSITLRADDQNDYRFLDTATGTELGSFINGVSAGGVTQVENGITVMPADGGAPVAFPWDDLNAVYTQALERNGIDPTVGLMPDGVVMHSVDGMRWSLEHTDDIVGSNVGFSGWLRGTGSQVIVAALRPAAPGEVPQQVLLVGTPTG